MRGYGAPGYMTSNPSEQAVPMELPKQLVRVGEQCVWTTQRFAAASALANTQHRIFAVSQGSTGQGFTANALTISETSLKEPNRIPTGYAFNVGGIACVIQSAGNLAVAANDLRNIQNNGVIAWDFIQTQIFVAPIMLIGAGGGNFGYASTTQNNTLVEQPNNGNGFYWAYRRHPVMLPSGSTFAHIVFFGFGAAVVGSADVYLKDVLIGAFQSAVEIG